MKRQRRTFSEAFKREKVKLLDEDKLSVRHLSDIYEVSHTAIYNWIRKFSILSQNECIVVEKISEAKKTEELYKQVRNLEQALGRKQLELDYYREVVKIASESTGEDFEKEVPPQPYYTY